VLFELFLVFAIRSPRLNLWKVGFHTNKNLLYAVLVSMALQIMVIYVPPFQILAHTTPLTRFDWLRTILISLLAFLAVELVEFILQRRAKVMAPTKVATA
jgi:Ca2+-transporting ATPase